ncbi:MAG: DUF2520 domain-containing protein [Candidatus Dormibacterales bacterium]
MPVRTGLESLIRATRAKPGAVVFLAVPDDAIHRTATGIARAAGRIPTATAFVHLSGASGLDALEPLAKAHSIGSFHPLQSFPSVRPPAAFEGITIALDSRSPRLMRRLARLARDLGARPKAVGEKERAAYHAAAVFASNYVNALMGEAVALLESVGWSEREAVNGLIPLATGALDNIKRKGPVGALTGPIRRGDVATVERHLQALSALGASAPSRTGPPAEAVYRMLGSIALEIAKTAGLEPAAAGRMQRALTRKVAATRRRGGR